MYYNEDYKQFLLDLDKCKNKTIYARITALLFNESPIETIEGRVTQGSINVDGSSAVRRSCSLTIVAQDFNYNDYYWGMNTKFQLEIGVQNLINPEMPDIIWFKQGIYVITSFNTSRSTNNFTISLQGKDKMCLLNGEVGGTITDSSVDFGKIEEEDALGNWIIKEVPIQEIIRNMLHQYAGEPFHNIIINDLDTYGLELLEYRYDTPMYFYRKPNSDIYENAMLESESKNYYIKNNGVWTAVSTKDLDRNHLEMLVDSLVGLPTIPDEEGNGFVYSRTDVQPNDSNAFPEEVDGKTYWFVPYVFAKVEYGQTAGYRTTDLVYAGDLIANVGESLTSVLDKIKNMLGEFEYFYDLDGRFVFQKKKSFINTLWTPIEDSEDAQAYVESLAVASTTAYTFSEGELITAFNNNPNLLNMKNDYSIWGERTSSTGAQIPVHMRYAIDKKPIQYSSIFVDDLDPQVIAYNEKYGTELKGQKSVTYISGDNYKEDGNTIYCDWREVIYRMALDFYKYNHFDDFELRIIKHNPELYFTGQTGYEQYYIDLQGFWRQLYYPGIQDQLDEYLKQIEEEEIIITNLNGTWSEGVCVDPGRIQVLEGRILKLEQEIAKAQTDVKTSETQIKNLTQTIANQNYSIGVLTQEEKELQERLNQLQETANGQGAALVSGMMKDFLDSLETELTKLLKIEGQQFSNYTELQQTYDALVEVGTASPTAIANALTLAEAAKEAYHATQDNREYIEDLRDIVKEEYENLGSIEDYNKNQLIPAVDSEIKKVQSQISAIQSSLKELQDALDKEKANCETLKDTEERITATNTAQIEVLKTNSYVLTLDETPIEGRAYYKIIPESNPPMYEYYHYDNYDTEEDYEKNWKPNFENKLLYERDDLQELENRLVTAQNNLSDLQEKYKSLSDTKENYYTNDNDEHQHWARAIYETPEVLNFWFDFLDSEGELSQFSVKSMGARSKAVNDKDVKSIYFRETPSVIFIEDVTEKLTLGGYRYIQVSNIDTMFSISAQGKSAKDQLDELIYKHSYCIESATITTIPIYYLEPNVRIYLFDKETGLEGDYIVSKLTIPLAYNGTMSITATKAAESIL